MGIDFEITNKFQQIGKFENMKSTNNENFVYLFRAMNFEWDFSVDTYKIRDNFISKDMIMEKYMTRVPVLLVGRGPHPTYCW